MNSSFPVRKLFIDLPDGLPRYWHGGDPFRTLILDSLSMMLPEGEQTFIESIRLFSDVYEGDPALNPQVKSFIGQEASHRHLHAWYNEQLAQQGYINVVESQIRNAMLRSKLVNRFTRLSIVMAFEHFTAILGDIILRHQSCFDGADPRVARIWLWHGAEENEHKAVAFDVYRAAGGGYVRRIFGYFFASIFLPIHIIHQVTHSLIKDKKILSWETWKSAIKWCFIKPGIFWLILPHWLRYFSPLFHPLQHDNNDLVNNWLEINKKNYRKVTQNQITTPTPRATENHPYIEPTAPDI